MALTNFAALTDEQTAAIDSIISNRHQLSHGRHVGITFTRVKNYFRNIEQVIILQPLERTMVPTGIFIEVPEGYEAQIRPRSGLAVKQGITCLNTPGTIDSDYRGEIKVILINLSNTPQQINNGDRIAQMVFTKVERARFFTVTQLEVTTRGTGGFGHTGVQ